MPQELRRRRAQEQQQQQQEEPADEGPVFVGDKTLFSAFLLWLLGGVFGLHHFYLGRPFQGALLQPGPRRRAREKGKVENGRRPFQKDPSRSLFLSLKQGIAPMRAAA